MTTIADLQLQREVPVAFYTKTIRSTGTWTCLDRRFSDSLNGRDVEFLDLKQAAMQPLVGQAGELTRREEGWVRRADIVFAVPLDGEEHHGSRAHLTLPRQRMGVVLGAWPFTITGDLHLASGGDFQEHLHDYRDRFMAITDAQVTCHTAPALSVSAPFLMVNRASIDTGGKLQAAASGKLSPAESLGDALVTGGFPQGPLDDAWASLRPLLVADDDDDRGGWEETPAPAESRRDASREDQPGHAASWLEEEWAGNVEPSVARTVAAAPAAPKTPTWMPLLSPLPPLGGAAVEVPSSTAAAVLAGSRMFRPEDEPVLQKFCKRLADEAGLFPARVITGRQVRGGEQLFSGGQRGDVLFVVGQGMVQLLTADGWRQKERHREYRGPGDLLGEVAVLGDGVHIASARAVTDTMVLELRTATLSLLMQRFPRVTTRILDFVRSRATHVPLSLV
jgi:CRP-like cAMP-binding protein